MAGGEGSRPKIASVSAPNQRTGQAASGPFSSFAAGTSFLGAQLSESGFIPPDSMGAVGPSQVVVDVNGRIKVFDKQGNLGGLNVSDNVFWNSVRNGSEPTDPGVEYDRLTGHWIISAINEENTNNRVMIAVSSGPTITDSSSFTFYFFNQNVPPPAGDGGLFADYPQLGVDANAIYIGVNQFSGNSFAHSTGFVIRKSSVIGGGPIVVTAFRDLTGGASGPGPASPQGVTNMVPGNTEGYFVGADNQVLSKLDVRRVSTPGGNPTISSNLQITVPSTAQPLSVPASGSHHNLDPLDDRLFEAMINKDPNGVVSLWTAHNIRVNSSGVGTSLGDRDADRWYQLGSLDTTPALLQSGTLFDTAAATPRFFWIPSIAMNGQGHASLNSSTAGSGRFAEIASSGHLATDLPGTTEPFDTTQTSSSSYNVGSPNPQRWGDYSQTVVDPTDNMTFWTFQEYANAKNSWGLRVIKEKPPPPATPSSASPSSVALGQSSVSVQITGTSSGGSGFFDPGSDPGGPGWANHIGASVSGGVTVNSVTYTDPTHVTLSLNTTAASNGAQDVTITNPDGQSSTGFNLLDVGSGLSAPALTGTSPASPANDNNPEIVGSAQSGTTVNLFTNSSCTGSPVASDTAANFASPGITVSVADNTTTTFYAAATDGSNTSACSSTRATSGSVTYVEDSSPPAAPSSLSVSPTSPANDNDPVISGAAESGSTVRLYTNSTCTSAVAASGSASEFASPGLTVPVADNTSTTFRATATDAAGNTSPCSSSSVTYVEDTIPPTAPTIGSTNPASPSSSTTPKVIGSSSSDTATVQLFTQANCVGSVQASGSKATFESTGIQVTVGSNQTTTFSAQALDAAGNPSACSNNFSYTNDSIPPAAPTITSTSPSSPSSSTTPKAIGTSSSDTATLQLYTQANCGGSVQATGTKATFGSTGIQVTVGSNATTTLSAKALDGAGNSSACSNNFSYTNDSIPPAAPTITSTSPSSPSSSTTPRVIGTSSSDTATVQVFTQASCGGSVQASGSKATFESTGIQVTVGSNQTTTLSTKALDAAGNPSGCSNDLSYTQDSTLPAAPTLTGTTPVSPGSSTTPKVLGSADPGTTVKIYNAPTESDCTAGNLAASGTAANFASPGITVTVPVPTNSSTIFRATATDAASNVSPCSPSSVTYVDDATPPTASIDSGPSGTTNDHTPTFTFSATDSFPPVDPVTFQCSLDQGTAVFAACSGPGASHTPAGSLSDGSYTFRVRAIDQAGNVSAPATRAFTVTTPAPLDQLAPETTITKGPKKKTTKRRPRFTFASSEFGSTFQCQLDAGQFQPCSSPFKPPKLRLGKHKLRVEAIDPAGNVDPTPAVRKFKVVA